MVAKMTGQVTLPGLRHSGVLCRDLRLQGLRQCRIMAELHGEGGAPWDSDRIAFT
jgi:hypothetical protein